MQTFLEPIDMLASDIPNACPFDGVRTKLIEVRDNYTVEQCPYCHKLFNYWEDQE